jgi:hypothetical protein
MPFLSDRLYAFEKLVYRIEGILRPSGKLPPEGARDEAKLPSEGATVSVEMALNSRCSSDYDGNPRKFHWGMFDRTKKLSEKQVGGIVALAAIPRFTDGRVAIRADGNTLTLSVGNQAADVEREWLMVESGMQQQSVGLVCSALGVGMVMRNLGKDGLPVSDEEHATVKIRLDAMKPSYRGSFWTDMAPTGRAPWLRGNLPDPVRDGQKPLLTALAGLTTKTRSSEMSTEESMGQLLWAARGRTPHLYKSRPWGLTIPSWGGEQNISSVYAISDNVVSKYENWKHNRPTHTLMELKSVGQDTLSPLSESLPPFDRLIVICSNEDHNRSLWEVGYQLLNILVQAKALDIPYEAALLDENRKRIFRSMGIKNPVAIIML